MNQEFNEFCKRVGIESNDAYIPFTFKKIYINASNMLLDAIIDKCTGDIGTEYDGLINHVTHAVPLKQGFDQCAVYGDYFYLESLLRLLKPDWERYW